MADNLKRVEILLVESNAADAQATLDGFRRSKVCNRVQVIADGREALACLRREGRYQDASRPDLVILDLDLLHQDGREVLAAIKRHPELRRIPVVVLTGSQDAFDVLKAYDLHANCFVSKPLDTVQFLHVVQSIESFWLTIVVLPPGN